MSVGFYPGSFDPFTNGHLAVLRGALNACDRVVMGVGVHALKVGTTPFEDRAALIGDSLLEMGVDADRFAVVSFDGLAVVAAVAHGAGVFVRGVRDGTDLDYEMQLSGMNATLAPGVQTLFVPASPDTRHVTGTLVRQIAAMGGDVKPFVPPPVHRYMQRTVP